MRGSITAILVLIAASCLGADPTNTIVTARVTAHRMTAAGSMDPGGGFYLYQTDFIVTAPTNSAGVVLTMESIYRIQRDMIYIEVIDITAHDYRRK
jgi:hypothetical protein